MKVSTQSFICLFVMAFGSFLPREAFAQDSTNIKTLDQVIVTGQYAPQSLKNSVYKVQVVSAEKIKLSGAVNVQQALNTELGIRFSTDKIIGSNLSLNGVEGQDIKILLDGIPLSDRSDERISLSQVDVNTIERIEIVQGPMSVSYGTDAMGGVINIITKKNYKNGFSLSARAQEESASDEYYAFSYKGVHTQSLNVNYKKNSWNFSAGGSHIDFDGLAGDEYGRGKSWLPKEQWFGNGKIGFSKNKFNAYYRLDGLKETLKDRNPINFDLDVPFAKARDQQFRTDRFMHQVQGEYGFSDRASLTSQLGFTSLTRKTVTTEKDFIEQTAALGTQDGEQDVSKLHSFSVKNTVQYRMSEKISVQPGIDITSEKARGQRIAGEPTISDYAFFASAEFKPTAKINIRPGVRVEHNSVYKAPPLIPSINTKFALSKSLDLRLSYGYGFRAPVLRELYFIFRDANHNIFGNPNLKAENSNSLNGSLTWAAPKAKAVAFNSSLNLFYNSFRDQIDLDVDQSDNTKYSYFNIGRVKTAGFGLENRFSIKHFDADFGFTYIGYDKVFDPSVEKKDERDFLWSPEVNANFIYKFTKIKTSFGFFYKYIGNKPQFISVTTPAGLPAAELATTNAYNLADFTATVTAIKFLTISAGVKNIFDVTNVTSTTGTGSTHSNGGDLSVNYGRSCFIGLNVHFAQKK